MPTPYTMSGSQYAKQKKIDPSTGIESLRRVAPDPVQLYAGVRKAQSMRKRVL